MVLSIIQVRTGSTRFPKKILEKIYDKTLLELYVNRVRPSKQIDKVVIATTENSGDDIIVEMAKNMEFDCFRGSEMDLLDRYYRCAKQYNPDIVVRITPDDPFVDYEVVNRETGETYQLSRADWDDLIRLHLCDWMEQLQRMNWWDYRREGYAAMARHLGGTALQNYDRVLAMEPDREAGLHVDSKVWETT